ncbi:MAG: hypothetical protein O2862_08795 [Bacteroidetes bacterium]|nr:hypothetical protein [Bacteroidota bacterium]
MYTLIRSETEYQRAIERLELIFEAKPDTPEGEELELLSLHQIYTAFNGNICRRIGLV